MIFVILKKSGYQLFSFFNTTYGINFAVCLFITERPSWLDLLDALQYPIKFSIYYFPPAPTFQGQMRGGKETAGGEACCYILDNSMVLTSSIKTIVFNDHLKSNTYTDTNT